MMKAELKALWGVYCDTDKLVDDMMALLTKYHHDCTEHGVCEILNTYFVNKKHLIDMFMKSENYIGNMRILIDIELERTNNAREIRNFCDGFSENVDAKEIFLKYVDEDGKTLKDYLRIGVGRFKARDLCYGNLTERVVINADKRNSFTRDGATKKSVAELSRFGDIICCFRDSNSTLSAYSANGLAAYKVDGRFAIGMKTSRAFNRVCSIYGVDKLPKYNKLFAEYADMVSGLARKLKFYISLNPLDYLTMSFGNSWSSCHTIDKKNERNMPNSYSGMSCGGVLSYLLDGTSIITYVHTHATEDHEEGKLYRNMFHFDDGTLVQGRVYPQGNDGATDLYKAFRRFVQIEFTKLLGLEEDDWLRRSSSASNNVASYGVHYRDYEHFGECCTTYPREMPSAASNIIAVGHSRICPNCGRYVDDEDDTGMLCHEDCDSVDEDDPFEW